MTARMLRFACAAAIALAIAAPRAAFDLAQVQQPAAAAAPEYGPAKGTLVIVGGGNLNGSGINEKFIELAGGPEKNFVIVPTAGGNRNAQGLIAYEEERIIAPWVRLGLKHVKMLHTHDPKVADTEEFARVLRTADAVWFNGGRQWNIVDSYANTLTYREFHKVLERGGVIGGSSAGATIQGEYLVRGDTSGADVMMTAEPNHQEAFKFLRKVAIDQHINTRNRWDHLIPVIQKYPQFLGIGLSESTAIIVNGDRFEVMGAWKVADTEAFAGVLRDADGVWFNGGRQWNIVDSYANTLTYREFHKVLERGGVIGGSSAGATIQGDYLVRGAISGSDVMMTPEPNHERAFQFLRHSAIDQHINTRNRWDDLIPVIQKYPNLLGIGLSEGTAIVVKGDQFEVMGKWKVAVHDNTQMYQPWEKPYYILGAGDVYNMKTR